MAEDIRAVARDWIDSTAELMVNAMRDWDHAHNCPTCLGNAAFEYEQLTLRLVGLLEQSGRHCDPTPLTECLRFAKGADHFGRHVQFGGAETAEQAKQSYDRFLESFELSQPLLYRIGYKPVDQPPNHELIQSEQELVEVIRESDRRLTQKQILKELSCKGLEPSEGMVSQTLAYLVRFKVLTNNYPQKDERGRGYGLPEWSSHI